MGITPGNTIKLISCIGIIKGLLGSRGAGLGAVPASIALGPCLVTASDPFVVARHSTDAHFPNSTSETRRAGDVADGDLCVVVLDGSPRRPFTY